MTDKPESAEGFLRIALVEPWAQSPGRRSTLAERKMVAEQIEHAAPMLEARDRAIREEIVDLLPRCRHHEGVGLEDLKMCQRVATKEGSWPDCEAVYCDEHSGGPCDYEDEPGDDLPWAHVVRDLADRGEPKR